MDFDDIDNEDVIDNLSNQEETSIENTQSVEQLDLIDQLLNERGIQDKTKINFEGDNGEITEVDWNNLSVEEQLNILRSTTPAAEDGLDASEINMINSIRSNNLTPEQYIKSIEEKAIENYKKSQDQTVQTYQIDQYSDDELFVLDLLNKVEGITEEEAEEALNTAKQSNQALFTKQVNALRNEYKQQEEELSKYAQFQEEQRAKQEYDQYARTIYNSVNNLNQMFKGTFNVDADDKQQMYELLTGFDDQRNSWFGKVLNDPDTLAKISWYLLYGDKAFEQMQNYYAQAINTTKPNSSTPKSVYKPVIPNSNNIDDIDREFI